MPKYKNIHPYGEVELVLPQVDDDKGNVVSPQRIVFLEPGEEFDVSDVEETLIAGQVANYVKVEAGE